MKGEELVGGTGRVALDLGLAGDECVAQQQPDLNIAADQTEEGAERRLGVVEVEQTSLAPGFQQRGQSGADGEAAIGQHDAAEIALARGGMADRGAIERDRGLARDHIQPVLAEIPQALAQRRRVECLAIIVVGTDLRRLPLHRRGQEAVAVADTGQIVTIGIQPYEPATGFGYIRAGAPLVIAGAPSARAVDAFVEKPSLARARRYLASGEYLWNAGMFIARADRLLEEIAANRPELARGLGEIADAWTTDARDEVCARVWPGLEKIAIDYTVAEPAAKRGVLAVIPGYFQWDAVGDFASVSRLRQAEAEAGTDVVGSGDASKVVSVDARGLVITGGGRVVAVAGLDDVVVVDTPDALLVTTRAKAQEVKQIVEELRAQGLVDVL